MRISSQHLGFVPARVRVRDSGLSVDLSADVVQMAFPVSEVAPASGDWKSATWETDATSSPVHYSARCLVKGVDSTASGGSVILGKGVYDVWVKVTHGSETAVLQATEADGKTYSKLVIY